MVTSSLRHAICDCNNPLLESTQASVPYLHLQAAENAAQRVERVFLDALLAASAGQQHAKAWEGILHAAFAELKNANFKEPWRIDGKLLALDVLLQPNLLQKALVCHLTLPAAMLTYPTRTHMCHDARLSAGIQAVCSMYRICVIIAHSHMSISMLAASFQWCFSRFPHPGTCQLIR